MKLINSSPIKEGLTFSAGYTHGCSVSIIHGKPKTVPEIERYHYHSKDSEYFYVVQGALTVNVNGKNVLINKGQCLETEPLEKHKIVGLDEGTEYLIIRTNILPAEKTIVE